MTMLRCINNVGMLEIALGGATLAAFWGEPQEFGTPLTCVLGQHLADVHSISQLYIVVTHFQWFWYLIRGGLCWQQSLDINNSTIFRISDVLNRIALAIYKCGEWLWPWVPATPHWWSPEIAETDGNSPCQIIWPVSSLVSSGVQLCIIHVLQTSRWSGTFQFQTEVSELTGLSEPFASQVKQFQSPVLTLDTFEDYAPCFKQSCKGSIQFHQLVSQLGHQIHRNQGLWRPMASNTSSLFCFNRWWRATYSVRTWVHDGAFQWISICIKVIKVCCNLFCTCIYMRVHVVHCAALSSGSVDQCTTGCMICPWHDKIDKMSDPTSDRDRGISTCGTWTRTWSPSPGFMEGRDNNISITI